VNKVVFRQVNSVVNLQDSRSGYQSSREIDALTAENTELLRKMPMPRLLLTMRVTAVSTTRTRARFQSFRGSWMRRTRASQDTQQALDEAQEGEKAQTE
jgi:hypothetical protein